MRHDDDGVLAAVAKFHVSFRKALRVPLAERSHHVVAASAVPLAGLAPAPGYGRVEESFQGLEVAATPGFQTLACYRLKVIAYFVGGYIGQPRCF